MDLIPCIPIPMEDDLVHTAANGYNCGDPTCYGAGGSDDDHSVIVEGSLIQEPFIVVEWFENEIDQLFLDILNTESMVLDYTVYAREVD